MTGAPELTRIDPSRYTSAEVAARELERLWPRVWNLVGPAGQLENDGDWITFALGPESVVLTRAGGEVRGMFNVCPHRGSRICRTERGHDTELRSPYHGWTFGLDGTLRSAPSAEDFPETVRRGEEGLEPVRVESFGGLLWVCLDAHAPPLGGFLGEMGPALSTYRLDQYTPVAHTTVELACNWKAFVDGVNEAYHVPVSHPQLLEILDPTAVVESELLGRHGRFAIPMGRAHERDGLRQQILARGARRGADYGGLSAEQLVAGVNHYVFPNVIFDMHPERFILLRALPAGLDPGRMQIDEWVYERGDPPPAVRRRVVRFPEQSISAVMDVDAHNLIAVQQGMQSRGFRGLLLGRQEERIAHMHRWIELYLGTPPGRPVED
jgi:phenylpropionate dioxygenase-like ring-hydroxylating dioxygenase large terminal subunit